jgi:hypothetical protein
MTTRRCKEIAMPDDSAPPAPPAQTVPLSGRYVVIVGGLMLLIVVMLAFLWTTERRRRQKAEDFIVELQAKNKQDQQGLAQMMMGQMVGRGSEGPSVRPFLRQDHVPVSVTLDGAKRQAYLLPASGGERFGFQAGDVIVVEAAPTTGPAPGSASGKPASSPAGD